MSSYPPNMPPPPPDPNNPYAWQAQQKAYAQQQKAQARVYAQQQKAAYRLQRAQMKAQARAARRGSLVGPLLLVTLGVLFLLNQTGWASWSRTAAWYGHWWPLILIGVGCVLLGEWAFARQRTGVGGPVLGGGVLFLLILLASIGFSMRFVDEGRPWAENFLPGERFHGRWQKMMGDAHEFDTDQTNAIAPGQALVIRNPHGDVVVTGASTDNQVHVAVHTRVYAWKSSDAESHNRDLQPVFSNEGNQLVLTIGSYEGGTADLTIEMPHAAALTVEDGHGDVNVSELHAPITLNVNHGNIDLNGLDGNVTLRTDDDDAAISGHSITGQVQLDGRAGDMTFSDVAGGVALNGDFFGTTHLERINGVVRFQTSRTQFQAARLDGEFEVDGGSDLEASQLLGPVTLNTHDRNITLDRVEGRVEISNRNGSVNVTNAPPLGGIKIVNHKGSVDVGLPVSAGFTVDAQTHNGDLENDFGLSNAGSDDHPSIKGNVAGGGPVVSIITSDGDVTLRKTTVAPLPPSSPTPPNLTTSPIAPVAPATPVAKAPKAPKVPTAPKSVKPVAPTPPAAPGGMI